MKTNRDLRLDFLKGIAFLLVFAVHSVQFIKGIPAIVRFACMYGQTGVQLFLMVSGILFAKSYQKRGTKRYLPELGRKYWTIMPLFICFAFVYMGLNGLFSLLSIEIPFRNNTSVWALLVNALLLHGFFPFANNNVVPGGWYIGAYFAMLITAPLIMAFSGKVKKHNGFFIRLGVAVSVSLTVVSAVLLYGFDISYTNGDFAYFSFINQYPAFLIGMGIGASTKEDTRAAWIRAGGFVLFSVLAVACFVVEQSWCYSLVPMLAALSFSQLYYLLSAAWATSIVSKLKYLSFLGKHSFSAYLLSFIFTWYVPLAIEKYIKLNGMLLWLVSWVVMLVLLPVISCGITGLQTRIGGLFKRNR